MALASAALFGASTPLSKLLLGDGDGPSTPEMLVRPFRFSALLARLHALNAEARRFAELIEPMVVNFCHGLTDSTAFAGVHRLLPRH